MLSIHNHYLQLSISGPLMEFGTSPLLLEMEADRGPQAMITGKLRVGFAVDAAP